MRQIAEAYAEAWPGKNHNSRVAREAGRYFGEVKPHQVTPLQLQTLIESWRARFTRNTLYGRRHALKRLLRHIEALSGVEGLARELPRVAHPRPRQTVAQPGELQRLYAHADPWLRVWLQLSVSTALRQADVRRLAPIHYDAERRLITLEVKGENPHTLPVSEEIAFLLENAPPCDDPTVSFLTRYRGQTSTGKWRVVSEQSIAWWWRRLKQRVGANPNLWPHDLRRTSAEAVYNSTRDIRLVQHLLGHQSLLSTTAYLAHKNPQELRPIVAQLHIPLPTEVKQ